MKCYIILMLLFLSVTASRAQEFSVMFYNTENLFDAEDDSLKDDDEFLPEGARRWTHSRYWKKLDAISRVIVAAGGWDQPLYTGLCEVENLNVAYDLISRPLLQNLDYGIIHRESPDPRGIDVCLLYRRSMVTITDVRSWVPEMENGDLFTSRNLLYVKSVVFGDTLHMILCHWPSRRGGTLASENVREKIAFLLDSKIDSILASDSKTTSLVLMGDFNALPDDPLMKLLSGENRMINLSVNNFEKSEGSYRFHGMWEMIDQVIVSGMMADTIGPFYTAQSRFTVFDAPFLLEDDPDYPGKRPLSSFRGFSWSDGYSDHLPVIVKILHR